MARINCDLYGKLKSLLLCALYGIVAFSKFSVKLGISLAVVDKPKGQVPPATTAQHLISSNVRALVLIRIASGAQFLYQTPT